MIPLRQCFLDDLRLRNYSPRTLKTYLAHVVRFSKHFQRSPDLLGPDEIRTYQLGAISLARLLRGRFLRFPIGHRVGWHLNVLQLTQPTAIRLTPNAA